MKKTMFLIYFACCASLFAQSKMYIHSSDNMTMGVPLSAIDSISLNGGSSALFIRSGSNSTAFPLTQIDSISFAESSDTVCVDFNQSPVAVFNPLAFENVSVAVNDSSVIITSTSSVKNLNYKISGTAEDRLLKIYSSSKFNLIMNNLNLTNADGPAISLPSGNKTAVILPAGTVNSLTDGTSYADTCISSAGATEDQTAAFFSKGDLNFSGTGSLTINGRGADKHALYSKDAVKLTESTLIISSADKDGIHPKDGITIESGTLNVKSTGDGIDTDGYVTITGGKITVSTSTEGSDGIASAASTDISNAEVNVTVAGDKSKGIVSDGNITIESGTVTVNSTGSVLLEAYGSGYDPSYATAIKSDSSVFVNGGSIIITSTGKGGKGISADGNIVMTSGTVNVTASGAGAKYVDSTGVTDSYHSTCIGADGNIILLGGTVTTSSSGAAGRGISSDGRLIIGDAADTVNIPNISVTTTGTKILLSGSGDNAEYDEAKTINSDGIIIINNGTIYVSSADDGIKSDSSITFNNGTINIAKAVEGIEAPYVTINKGTINVSASDDGINTTKGNGGESNDGSCLYINGGNINVSVTGGDGLDSNGSISMTGGTVVVNGPSSQPEVGLDYNGTFNISGGFLIVSGPNSGNMIQATSTTSSQYTVKATTSSQVSSSTIFNVQNASGASLVTFKPLRNSYYFIFSSSELKSGSSYSIYTGGTSSGTYVNGLYTGGTYSGGSLKKTFTVSGKVTSVSF